MGRQLELDLGNGMMGGGVAVPTSGFTAGNESLTTTGGSELVASNVDGVLTVSASIPSLANAPVAPDADAACSESAYNLEGGRHWTTKDKWYYNQSTASQAGLTASATTPRIRQANTNMTHGINNCNLPQGTFSASGGYQGNTSRYANVNASGDCTSQFPDGQNTVSWQHFNNSNLLGLTCFIASGSTMTEADTALATTAGIVASLSPSCSNKYDLESIMTHEWGHAYGLAHETSGTHEVMYPTVTPCAPRRHLGKGDYDGMNSLY